MQIKHLPFLSFLRSSLADFSRDERGVSAIEFAIVIPVMCLLAVGSWEVTKAVLTKRKTAHLATSIANLASQDDYITVSDQATFEDIAEKILFPYNGFTHRIGIMGVEVDSDGDLNVSCQFGDAEIDSNTIPEGLRVANTYYVLSAVEVEFKALNKDVSFLGSKIGLTDMTFRDTALFSPRSDAELNCEE
ncbi:TadE/TadG family type IV pilus assembly protein [uncultured Cohaesibacter sp.]|uniref:TadE/TadG family type IV pilus assembly protein n=1 Tax=uncultured Cohaesibacter sp. TaxID=1002546 RepID=UPI00292F52B7|nr:TadE/TadG family type IV pilus assembly protein [uncultured Cohaesibacter sp.]